MLIWLMNFTEAKVTCRHWCFHTVSLVPVLFLWHSVCVPPSDWVFARRCDVSSTFVFLLPSTISGIEWQLNKYLFSVAQYLWVSLSELMHFLRVFGFPDIYISRADQSLLPTVWLYYTIKSTQFRCALRKPGACAKVMCVCFKEPYFLGGEPEATGWSPDLTTVSYSWSIF